VAARHDGMSVVEVLGKHLFDAFPSLTEDSSTLLRVMKTTKPIFNQAKVYLNLHGIRIDTINTTLPIFLGSEIIGAVEIAKDYSRMKLLAERLLDLQKGLQKGGKKEALKQVKYTLMTVNPSFISMKKEAMKLAKSDSPILVYGESGTGKELFVQGMHHESLRTNGPFIAQNCAAIPETLLESILFTSGARNGFQFVGEEWELRSLCFELLSENTYGDHLVVNSPVRFETYIEHTFGFLFTEIQLGERREQLRGKAWVKEWDFRRPTRIRRTLCATI
jgi:transcriptional regulator with PAS, ATPase and Fis domain